MPREGTELAVQQKEFEEGLSSQEVEAGELDEAWVRALVQVEGGGIGDEELEDPDLEFGGLEAGFPDEDSVGEEGFFYENKEEEEKEDKNIRIGARVAARRRGHLHNGGGQME